MAWPSFAKPTKKMDKLNQDFREFIELLGNEDVRYLIGGGHAVALHGFPRYTGSWEKHPLPVANVAKLTLNPVIFTFPDC